jgi:hypothetical protein
MNGRTYRLWSCVVGTQSRSWLTSSSTARTNASSGSSGIAIRAADRRNLAALAQGRNSTMGPAGCR